MTLHDYEVAALRTAKDLGSTESDLLHAALGIASEGGEFISEVKRVSIYGKAVTVEMNEHMVEELGDLLWYIAVAARGLGVSLEDIAQHNIAKLACRYPEKYSDLLAESRLDKGGLDHTKS